MLEASNSSRVLILVPHLGFEVSLCTVPRSESVSFFSCYPESLFLLKLGLHSLVPN